MPLLIAVIFPVNVFNDVLNIKPGKKFTDRCNGYFLFTLMVQISALHIPDWTYRGAGRIYRSLGEQISDFGKREKGFSLRAL